MLQECPFYFVQVRKKNHIFQIFWAALDLSSQNVQFYNGLKNRLDFCAQMALKK